MTSHENFNLIDDPWIPVAGHREQSLKEVFSDRSLLRLSGNPVDKIVVLRLLLSIVHASNKIPDMNAWLALSPEEMARNVLRYLEAMHDRFFLFGDKPFLQVPELADKGKPTSFEAYQVNMSENQVVISHWNQARESSTPDMIRLLLRYSCYSCGGKGKRFQNNILLTEGYRGKLNKQGNTGSGTCGTLLGRDGYLHTYLLADSLLDTLRFNLLTEEEIAKTRAFPDGLGVPFWEEMPHGEDCPRARNYRRTYLGELFPLDKFSFIKGRDGFIMTNGIDYPNHKDGLIDPALTIIQEKNDKKAVWASTSKKPWRELPALLSFLEANARSPQPYFLSAGLKKLGESNAETVHIWAGGMQVTNKAGEQRVSGYDDYVESEFRIPVQTTNGNGFNVYKKMMEKLDSFSNILKKSIINYFKTNTKEKNKKTPPNINAIAERAIFVFWERMAPSEQRIINIAFGDTTEEQRMEEYKKWAAVAREVYNQFCPRETARQLTAWVESEPNFTPKKAKSPQPKG